MSQAKLRSEMSKMAAPERADAILGAGLYREALKRRGRSHPIDGARWVAAREFAPLAAAEKARPKQQFVRRGTRAWDAWWRYKTATTGVSVEPFYVFSKEYGCEGRFEPTLFPPKLPSEAAEAQGREDDEAVEF